MISDVEKTCSVQAMCRVLGLLCLLARTQGIPVCRLSDITLPETALLPANPTLKHGDSVLITKTFYAHCNLWENGLREPEGEWVKTVSAVGGRREDRSGGREDSFASLLPHSELYWHLSFAVISIFEARHHQMPCSDIGYWTSHRLLRRQPRLA